MTTKDKALALVKQFYPECRDDYQGRRLQIAMAAFEQHEAFRQEVSDALLRYHAPSHVPHGLQEFIIPAPKPDPLVDVAKMMGYFNTTANHWAEDVRAALDALGFEIREKNDDQNFNTCNRMR